MDVIHLALTLGVKVDNAAACWRVACLFKVRAEARQQTVGALGDTVRLVSRLGAVCCVILLVKTAQRVGEA